MIDLLPVSPAPINTVGTLMQTKQSPYQIFSKLTH